MAEKDRQNGTKFELDMTNYIHNYIQGPFFGLKKWRKPLIYKDFRSGAGNRTWTCKYVRTHEPESCASANSAIPAFNGGQGWIRTTEVCDGRFTVCSLWPLGNLPINKL